MKCFHIHYLHRCIHHLLSNHIYNLLSNNDLYHMVIHLLLHILILEVVTLRSLLLYMLHKNHQLSHKVFLNPTNNLHHSPASTSPFYILKLYNLSFRTMPLQRFLSHRSQLNRIEFDLCFHKLSDSLLYIFLRS